ncbi:MAG: tetrahydromethanopterin S-methyltransferase subunit A [Methanosarcina sp.]
MKWPITSGDYVVGDINSNVTVVTLASDYRTMELKNYAICGTCFSENFGVEKIITNVLANPNITCLIVCGEESAHLPGQALIALAENGVTTMAGSRKIAGSKASLPYLNEIPMPSISRFLREIKVIDMIGSKDSTAIQKTIDSYFSAGSARREAYLVSMPEIDENTWRKYEKLITQNVMSKIKKG